MYRAAGVPKVSGVGNAPAFVGLLPCIPFSALASLFSFTGTACGGIFLRALTIEGDADIVAPIFDCADKVGVPLILNEAKRITLPSRLEIAAGTLFRPRNDDSEGTLGAPS
jgi:hypothetical protein